MAAHPEPAPDRAALIRRLDLARTRITDGVTGLRSGLDVRSRLRGSIAARPARLIGLATGAGLLFGLLRGGRRSRRGAATAPPRDRRSPGGFAVLAPVLLKFLIPLLKPALAAWAARLAAGRSRSGR